MIAPLLGSTWAHRRTGRRVVIVGELVGPAKRRRLRYRYRKPLRKSVTLYTRPYTSTRAETVEGFTARFRRVRR